VPSAWSYRAGGEVQEVVLVRDLFALGGLASSSLEAVRRLERVGGQDGDEEHDLGRENTGDGSTHQPSAACGPTSPANRNPVKTRVLTNSCSEPIFESPVHCVLDKHYRSRFVLGVGR